jgi:hypothetical protein
MQTSNIKIIYLLFLFVIAIYGCNESPTGPLVSNGFAVYFLQDDNIKIKDIINKDISYLNLKRIPWLSAEDIKFYDYSSHCIYLKMSKSDLFPDWKYLYRFSESWSDKPFAVTAGGKVVYVGYFSGEFSQNWWPTPHMDEFDVGAYPEDIVHISWVFYFAIDTRSNKEISNALEKYSVLHSGIGVTLDSIKINNGDTAEIEYNITITNNDKDNLYIFDPDKVSSGLFHFYNNGPNLLDSTKKYGYGSIYKKVTRPEPYYKWEPVWFTKLDSKKAVKRKIILKGYPKIPDGKYLCQYTYNGPFKIDKVDRVLSDGRYWMGFTLSNYLEIKVKNGSVSEFKKVGTEMWNNNSYQVIRKDLFKKAD